MLTYVLRCCKLRVRRNDYGKISNDGTDEARAVFAASVVLIVSRSNYTDKITPVAPGVKIRKVREKCLLQNG